MASLTITTGANQGDYYPLKKRTMVVGRDEGCPIQVLDDLVSRKHVQIRYDAPSDRYRALDMKSANGVLVNGRSIEGEVELADGDSIEIGATRIMFSADEFRDRQSALDHWRQRGQRDKSTLIQ